MKYIHFILLIFLSQSLFSQQKILNLSKDKLLRINYDNDFFSQRDLYYTQGTRIELIAPFMYRTPFKALLVRGNSTNLHYYGIAIERDGYTPKSIRIGDIYYGERPYAAVMFLSQFHLIFDEAHKFRTTFQFDLGVIGPVVGGQEEQTAIHKQIGGVIPQGWHNQIANDAVINYKALFEKGFVNTKYAELLGSMEGRVGTINTDATAGGMLRTGIFSSWFKNIGLTRSLDAPRFQCYVFIKGNLKAVGYNATMQGGVFNRNSVYTIPASGIERFVGTGYAGIVIAYKRFSMEYTKARITPEFSGGLNHAWGHCNINICF